MEYLDIYDENELDGVVKVNAKEVLDLFNEKKNNIDAHIYKNNIGIVKKNVAREDFLVNKGETLLTKYKDVLDKVIELTNNN